ncbi:gephyrin-like molybdotransferase Glp [Notoacmeibacter ruber]|uniref:Molybdopterin molybdenumtransferase n=1 Tax=Notoacmeibacter ruber TaxID=2670375 RepID=A0A3L7JBZ3_9HYPH|nr:gephyrin-like molybdotransferase Glp [Notoacmeibacter ruber]RLQ87964.1 molybdopterin molybdenumtransferase MoeA [Notoacmeibacter ruber]
MALLPVDEALSRLLKQASPLSAETVALDAAVGRILASPLHAKRTQPPFEGSAMDGYAVRAADLDPDGVPLELIGESAAGHPFPGSVEPGQTVRIFTGATMPDGADTVLMQENAERIDDKTVRPTQKEPVGRHVRPAGVDFSEGDLMLESGTKLDFAALSLAAAASHPTVDVHRKPRVAILATGDELKAPGESLAPGQIIASNTYGISAIVSEMGGVALDLGITPDKPAALQAAIDKAQSQDCDVIVTLGGASVGDHDLVQKAMVDAGMVLDFWKIAMRPGKPLMVGRLDGIHVLGLPGNPVSSMVCAHLFLRPLLCRLLGSTYKPKTVAAQLTAHLEANSGRQHYMRASASYDGDCWTVEPAGSQDSSLLRVMTIGNALIVRPPHAPAAEPGEKVLVDLWR